MSIGSLPGRRYITGPEFSEPSHRAIKIAEALGQIKPVEPRNRIYTEALLIALNEDENGPTRSMLRAFGIDRDDFLQWQTRDERWSYPVQEKYEPARIGDEDSLQLPYSRNTEIVLANAFQIAEDKEASSTRPRHLLAGLLENDECVAYNWLEEIGIDIPYVRKILNAVSESVAITPGTFVYAPGQAFCDAAVEEDALGFETGALALAEIIAKPETIPPVVIGVYGPWGSGKSTFLSLVRKHLRDWDEEHHPRSTRGKARQMFQRLLSFTRRREREKEEVLPHMVCVEFNAWAYTDAIKLWAGLVKQVSARLDQEITWWQKPFFWFRRNTLRLMGAIIVGLIPIALVLVAMSFESLWDWAAAQESVAKFLALLAAFGSSTLVFSKQTPLTSVVSSLVNKMDKSEAEGVMHRIQEELGTAVKRYFGLSEEGLTSSDLQGQVKKKMRQKKLKVVVFIDELDRCPLERIVDILEAIKLFLAEEIFIVLMAVDTRVVAEAIHLHYKDTRNPELAREYLEKIIQIPVRVPEADHNQLTQFVDGLMEVEQPSSSKDSTTQPAERTPSTPAVEGRNLVASSTEPLKPLDLPDTAVERDTIADFAAAYLHGNPRRIKRLLNTYRYVRVLATRQGDKTDDEKWQERMMNWLGFTMCWSAFMGTVVREARSPDPVDRVDDFLKHVEAGLPEDRLAEERRPPADAFGRLRLTKDEVEHLANLADNFLVENPPRVEVPQHHEAQETQVQIM